jgi:hypothetical protein
MNKRFHEVLAGVHDFYGKDLTPFALQVWELACSQFDVEQVTKALSAHLMDAERGQFMPKPADIVKQLQGTNSDRALLAWGKVFDAMQSVGSYKSVVFDDGLIHAVIEDLGGWPKICRYSNEELQFLQKRFCDSYRAYAGRKDVTYPAQLTGEHDQQNAKFGHVSMNGPMLIGDKQKALDVKSSGVSGPKTQMIEMKSALPRLLEAR